MKRNSVFAIILLIGLLTTCSDPFNESDDDIIDPNQKATIVFDNTQGICTVTVYSSYIRGEENIIVKVPAGKLSKEIEWLHSSSMSFFFSYQINFKGISGFTIDYIPVIGKDQKDVRIDPNIKTTIVIPPLDETISSPDTLLSRDSYLIIQNNSSYSLRLTQGSNILQPTNISESVVNSGERAHYTVSPGSTSFYKILVGADTISLPASLASLEVGRVYSFFCTGGVLSLISETELKLENVAEFSPNKPVPETPAAPLVIISDASLTVRWTAVNSAENYEVYLGTAQTPPNQPQRTVPGTTVVFSGLTNKTAYYVWVRAVNENGASDFSPRVRGIPWSAKEAPATPERPVIIPGINQLTVTWEECGGASSYEVYINTTQSTSSATVITSEKTSAVINNLYNDVVYYLWVRAVNNAGKSNYSPEEAGSPQIPTAAPSAPDKPVLVARNKELAVSWQAVGLAAAYEVWVGTTDNSAQAEKFGDDITGGVTETVITELINETTYYVWIKAKNIVGTSGFSSSANGTPSAFTVVPETPNTPTVIFGNRVLSISWQEVEGALFYEVWTSATGNSASAEKHGADVSGTSVIITDLNNGTTYYIWIKAKNNIGTSGFSHMTSGIPSASTEPPQAPESAPVVTAGNRELTISWQVVEGATAYELWAGTTINPTIASKKGDDVSTLSAVITGLTNDTIYYVWIKAKNSKGISGFSPVASGTPSVFAVVPQTPAAPTVNIDNGQITLNWTAVEGALVYEIWMGTSSNSVFAEKNGDDVAESELLSKTISGLSNGTVYYIWLKAKNNVGTSGFSPAASGTPIGNIGAISVSHGGDGELILSWAVVAGADQYEVYYNTSASIPASAAQTVSTGTATVGGLINGTTYFVWVKPKNANGTSGISASANATLMGIVGTVTVVSSNGQLDLSWPITTGANQYDVYHSTSSTMPVNSSYTVSTTTVTISGLSNGTEYYVWVKPKNATGSGYASTVKTGTPIGDMGAVTVSPAGGGELALSWAAVAGADQYEVYYNTSASIPASAAQTTSTVTATVSGLTNSTTYYVWVRPKNTNGTGGISTSANGIPIAGMGTVTVISGNGQLDLSWPITTGANQYDVYHSTSGTMPASSSMTASTTTATITGLSNGTEYYIWVRPKNATGSGNASTVITGTPIGNMGAVTVNLSGSGQLALSWTAVSGASEYLIYYGIGTDIPASYSYTNTSSSMTVSGLDNGTIYNFWVRPKNANGTGGISASANGIPMGSMGTVTVVSSNGQLDLSWSDVVGATQYEVYYSTNSTIPASPSQTVPVTSATISDLSNGTTYNVWVKPKNTTGSGNASTVKSGTPIGDMGAVTVSPAGSGQLVLSWAVVSGASEYLIYYGTGADIPASHSNTSMSSSTTISGLVNGTTYNFWVRPKNTNGTGGVSASASGIPIGSMGTVTVSSGDGQLDISWPTVDGADEYLVYHNTANTIPANPSQTVTTTTATISGLNNGTVYYVWVKPKNVLGSGSASAVSGTPLGLPGAPVVTTGFRGLLVTWAAVGGAVEYEVYYGTDTATILATTTTGTTAAVTGLTNGTTYRVRLRARYSGGLSDYGPDASGTPSDGTGLYRRSGAEKITGDYTLTSALSYISGNAASGDDYVIIIGANDTVAPSTLGYSGKTVGITLRGFGSERTVNLSSNGSMFSVNAGVTFTLDENIKLTGRNANNNSLIAVGSNGIFIMYGGTISGNTGNNGSGVNIYGGTFTMHGGIISGNTANVSGSGGGGIYVASNGNFTMNGGTISDNTARNSTSASGSVYGGGVYINGGTFTMNNGTINGNTANCTASGTSGYRAYGGGISINNTSTFTMNGGTISGNTASSSGSSNSSGGGGVSIIDTSTFTMNSGTISGNTASGALGGSGGGVYGLNAGGTFTMRGGIISGNTATNTGGGVSFNGTFRKLLTGGSSGIIYGSEAVGNDANGVPLKNTANTYGHAVYTSTGRYRNTTAGETVEIDSSTNKGVSANGEPPFGQ